MFFYAGSFRASRVAACSFRRRSIAHLLACTHVMRRTRFCCDPAHLFLMLTEYIFLSQALLKNIRAEKCRSRLFPGPKRGVLRWWGLNQSPLSWVVAPVAPPDQRIVLLVEVRPTAPHRHVAAIKQLPYSLLETMFALPSTYLYGSYVRVLPRLLHAS